MPAGLSCDEQAPWQGIMQELLENLSFPSSVLNLKYFFNRVKGAKTTWELSGTVLKPEGQKKCVDANGGWFHMPTLFDIISRAKLPSQDIGTFL